MAYRETPRMKARKEATRQRILDTTHALVAEGGFGLASVARVAENAGVAIGSVYRHFDSKSDLLPKYSGGRPSRKFKKLPKHWIHPRPPKKHWRNRLPCSRGAPFAAQPWPGP